VAGGLRFGEEPLTDLSELNANSEPRAFVFDSDTDFAQRRLSGSGDVWRAQAWKCSEQTGSAGCQRGCAGGCEWRKTVFARPASCHGFCGQCDCSGSCRQFCRRAVGCHFGGVVCDRACGRSPASVEPASDYSSVRPVCRATDFVVRHAVKQRISPV